MKFEGGCYCGAVRYEADGEVQFKGQCHCRECQYLSGGSPNVVLGMPEAGFRYVRGEPKEFRRADLDNPVTREFCATCGTQLTTRVPLVPGVVVLKVGTLDDPAAYGHPEMAIFTRDKQSFHHIPAGIQAFEGLPG